MRYERGSAARWNDSSKVSKNAVPEPNSASLSAAASIGEATGPGAPQHFFHFRPLPQGQGSFLPTLLMDSILLGRQYQIRTAIALVKLDPAFDFDFLLTTQIAGW